MPVAKSHATITASVLGITYTVAEHPAVTIYSYGWEPAALDSWTAGASSTIGRFASAPHTGSWHLSSGRSAGGGGGVFTATRAVSGLTVGRSYTLTVWYRVSTAGASTQASVGISGIGNSTPFDAPDLNYWQFTYTFTATLTTHTIVLSATAAGTGNTARWDDIVLTEDAWAETEPDLPLEVIEASITLDESRAPYAEARLTCAIPAEDYLEQVDPRDALRVEITASITWDEPVDKADQTRTFNLLLHERTVDMEAGTLELICESDEAQLIDYGLVDDGPDSSAENYQDSLRDIIDNVVLAPFGLSLEAGSDDADFTVTSDATNLVTNPSGETATTGYTAVPSTTGVAAVTSVAPSDTTAFGTKVLKTTWSTANTAAGGGCSYDVAVTAGLPYSFRINHFLSSITTRARMAVEWRTAGGTLSTVTGTETVTTSTPVTTYAQTFDTVTTDSWVAGASTTLSRVTTAPQSGAGHLQLARASGVTALTATRTITGLTVGRSYTAAAQVRHATGSTVTTPTAFLSVTGLSSGATATTSTSYQTVGYTFIATATSHVLVINATNASSVAYNVYYDTIGITETKPTIMASHANFKMVNQVAPATATIARVSILSVAGTSYQNQAIGTYHELDGFVAVQGTTVPTYFDGAGSVPADAHYGYAWTSTANASTSTRTRLDSRDPDLLKWQPGVSAWDFVEPLLRASGLRLFIDESRDCWLVDPATYAVAGAVSVAAAVNATRGVDSISLQSTRPDGSPVWYTGVVVRYLWTGDDGTTQTAYDYAGTSQKVYTVTIERPYPGPGEAAARLALAQGRGRTQDLEALADLNATPGMDLISTLPATPIQVGILSAVTWYWAAEGERHDLMSIRSRGLLDTPDNAWILALGNWSAATGNWAAAIGTN